jgi:hypothetical protein
MIDEKDPSKSLRHSLKINGATMAHENLRHYSKPPSQKTGAK